MNLDDVMLSEISHSQRQILYDSTNMKHLLRELKFIGTERRIVVARG